MSNRITIYMTEETKSKAHAVARINDKSVSKFLCDYIESEFNAAIDRGMTLSVLDMVGGTDEK